MLKDASQVKVAIMHREENCRKTMTEEARICKVLEENRRKIECWWAGRDRRENYENLKTKVISYSSNRAEQSHVGQADTLAQMDVDNASGSKKNVEEWEDVNELQRSMECCSCALTGYIARDRRGKGRGKAEGKVGGKEYTKDRGKAGNGKNDGVQGGGFQDVASAGVGQKDDNEHLDIHMHRRP